VSHIEIPSALTHSGGIFTEGDAGGGADVLLT